MECYTDESNLHYQQHEQKEPKLKLIPSSVPVDNNLTISNTWIHCRAPGVDSHPRCRVLFTDMSRLRLHERDVHGWQTKKGAAGGYAGTYQLIRISHLEVRLDRFEVEEKLREQSGQRILRRRRPRPMQYMIPDQEIDDGPPSPDIPDQQDSEFNPNLHVARLPFKCDKCRAHFPSERGLNRHVDKNRCSTGRPHACPYCLVHFRLRNNLRAHIRAKHSDGGAGHVRQLRDAPAPYSCEKCDTTMPSLSQFRKHQLKHGAVKPFACTFAPTVCSRRFWTKELLKGHVDRAHLRLHRENWFYCDKCPRGYSKEKSLKEHIKYCLMRMYEPNVNEVEQSVPGNSVSVDGTDLEELEQDPLATPTIPVAEAAKLVPPSSEMKKEDEPLAQGPSAVAQPQEFKFVLQEVGEIDIKDETASETSTITLTVTASEVKTEIPPSADPAAIKLEPGELQLPPSTTFVSPPEGDDQFLGAGDIPGQVVQISDPSTPNSAAAPSEDRVKMPPKGCNICPAPGCGKEFGNRKQLQRHVSRHNIRIAGGVLCDVPFCGRRLTSQRNLQLHMLTHTGETPFKCEYCGAGFRTYHGRTFHVRREHTRDLPYGCKFCDRRFVGLQHCQIHELRVHTREKNHGCAYCDKKFLLRRQLVQHERLHTGEKPLLCSYCGRGFARYNQRSRHQKRHQEMIDKMRALGMEDGASETAAAAAVAGQGVDPGDLETVEQAVGPSEVHLKAEK